jgi:hypothetical protein
MGQERPVQVYVLVTEQTIEENMLGTLAAKHDLFLAALDAESDVSRVDLVSGIEELRRRLEVLLGARPAAPVDRSQKQEVQIQVQSAQSRRERVAAAGGELLGAAFQFLGQLIAKDDVTGPPQSLVTDLRSRLSECVDEDGSGQQKLTVTLPDRGALDALAQTLARLLISAETGGSQPPTGTKSTPAPADSSPVNPPTRWQR